jgi:hypothetical protein
MFFCFVIDFFENFVLFMFVLNVHLKNNEEWCSKSLSFN